MKKANEQQACKLSAVLVEHHSLFTDAPSSEVQWAIQDPTEAVKLFVGALVDRAQQAAQQVAETAKAIVKKTLTPWKTIDTGGTTTEELLKAVKQAGNDIGDYAKDLTTKEAFVIAEKPEKADLVILTPTDLGFTQQPRTDAFLTKEFCAKWSAENLEGQVIELCQPEDGPQLRRQYGDEQPKGECLWMAMERITVSDCSPRVFLVERRGGRRWLGAGWVHGSFTWPLDLRLVFRLRKLPSPSIPPVP